MRRSSSFAERDEIEFAEEDEDDEVFLQNELEVSTHQK